jgi:hypothetical protein
MTKALHISSCAWIEYENDVKKVEPAKK